MQPPHTPSTHPRKLWRLVIIAVPVVLGGFTLLITPGNPLLRLFRRPLATFPGNHVIVGSYPNEEDFHTLKGHDVQLIVSLLDPLLPYERVLLAREEEMASKYHIRVANFPMVSILGKSMGKDYEANAQRATDAVLKEPGKVYVHCYLGLHRTKSVLDLLQAKGANAGTYNIGEKRDPAVERNRRLTEAEVAYKAGQFREVLNLLNGMSRPDRDVDILFAWSSYRIGDTAPAHAAFTEILKAHPDHLGALTGLGYCAFRQGNLAEADGHFQAALRLEPDNTEVLYGLAMLCHRQGRLEEAKGFLETLLKSKPDHAEARTLLDQISARLHPVPPPG